MPYLEGALVAIDNASGGIRALVGGRDYSQSKFNRALAPANRQVGSAFKPFVYTLAFTHGLLPGAAISDGPIQPGEIEGAGNWSPANSDGTYGGIQPVLVRPDSFPQHHERARRPVCRARRRAENRDDAESRRKHPARPGDLHRLVRNQPADLTAAYSVFPNAGVRKQSYIIERIDDQDHNPIYRAAHISRCRRLIRARPG